MNLFAISGLLIGISSISMAVLMLIIGKQRFHHIWGLFCVSVSVWGFGAYQIATTQNIAEADMWWRITHIGVIFIPILFTHFVYEFLRRKQKPLIPILYVLGFLFLWANFFSDLFIANMRWVFNQFYYDSPPGILYIPFTALFLWLVFCTHFLLWKALKTASGLKKIQIQYFLIGMAVSFAGGSLSFLPVYRIDLYPVLNIFAFLYTPIVTYAILKNQLFGIRTIFTQLLVGLISVLLFVNIFTSQAPFEYIWKTVLFVAFLSAGYLLIQSVLKEVRQKEELQKLTEKLALANENLIKLDKAKTEFVSIASHQLRTPLTAVKGYLSLILEGSYGKVSKQVADPLKKMYESNERLIHLVNDLLNISRIQSGKTDMEWGSIDIEKLVLDIMEELNVKAEEKTIELKLEKLTPSLPMIQVDREKIRNVLLNIIDNAIRYTEQGSITIRVAHADGSVRIAVQDTGQGMTKEEIAPLFESFTRGNAGQKMWTEGTGLGLYIAKQFIAMHKGKIWAESEGKGKGSTFSIELPIERSHA
ncbi:MAG: ATP-binding protein [Candidatus Yanofskybacteria bacterium]|nr:ATP-binding protein [Candidatus Yanofskybacteria bacterium]